MVTIRIKRMMPLLASSMLLLSLAMPGTAWAEEYRATVLVENHTSASPDSILFDITVDQVDAPNPGMQLDDTATVQAAGDVQWDIPVLWVSDSLQLCTVAREDESYLPVLAFFVPQKYSLEGGEYTVTLSPSLTKLFGGREIISVYDAATGITYILPASLRDLFAPHETSEPIAIETEVVHNAEVAAAEASADDRWQTRPQPVEPEENRPQPVEPEEPPAEHPMSLIDVHCSQTARDEFTDEDLEYLLDVIISKLQPQAVELLLEKFPAFRTAAEEGQIGREIGMYAYSGKGDRDGLAEHVNAPSDALVFVSKDAVEIGGQLKFCYLLYINLSSLMKRDEHGNPLRNPNTGKLILLRDGANMTAYENALVHELFHAFMDDYNRTGMIGATDLHDIVTDENGNWPSGELAERYRQTVFPQWFIEGTGSAVENVYQYRHSYFDALRTGSMDSDSTEIYSTERILESYLNATDKDGKDLAFALTNASGYDAAGNEIDVTSSRYVSGYLATVYLGELAARHISGSSITQGDDGVTISAEQIRLGLNSILERLHAGETLDQVIKDISPVDANGVKYYANTAEFESKFIRGAARQENDGQHWDGDTGAEASLEFVTTYLNYLNGLDAHMTNGRGVNGSILFDFSTDYQSPLNSNKEQNSDYFRIVESNRYTPSTVDGSEPYQGGGTSRSGSPVPNPTDSGPLGMPSDDEMIADASSMEAATELVGNEEPAPEPETVSEYEPEPAEPQPETEQDPTALPCAAEAPDEDAA